MGRRLRQTPGEIEVVSAERALSLLCEARRLARYPPTTSRSFGRPDSARVATALEALLRGIDPEAPLPPRHRSPPFLLPPGSAQTSSYRSATIGVLKLEESPAATSPPLPLDRAKGWSTNRRTR
jgi:hypothetical protein